MNGDLHRAGPAVALAGALVAALGGTGAARADDAAVCANALQAPYSMELRALTGPAGADLTVHVRVDPASGCAAVTVLKKIQLKTFAADGILASTRNFTDVAAAGGVASIPLGDVPRDRRVEADVLVQTDTPERTFVVRAATKTLLRPDFVVREIAPMQALAGAPFTVTAVIAERNGDVGAAVDVGLSAIPGSVEHVDVPKGGSATVSFPNVSFADAVPVAVTVEVAGADPAETDVTNNALTSTIDVTEHQLPTPANVLFPSFGGYGAQFNHHLYAPITLSRVPPGEYGELEDKIKLLEPQLVRIFYNDNWEENVDGTHPYPEYVQNYESFVKVVQLAQDVGATIDIAYQNLGNIVTTKKRTPEAAMANFANALEDLVRNHGLTNVRWAECANEPNAPTGAVTLDQYEAICRALNDQLVARGLRDQIHMMGGGLVESSGGRHHYAWMPWIATNMGDIFDAYAQHIYWWYDRPGRFEYRLRDVAHLMNEVLPPEQRKPSYMMEFGIRGYNTCGTKPVMPSGMFLYYRDASCTEIWRSNIAGFQQLCFAIDAAQLGFAGAAKWDAYWAVYDRNSLNQQVHWLTGPASENYPLTPSYNAMSLLFHTTVPGWQIVRVEPWADDDRLVPGAPPEWGGTGNETSSDTPEQELAAFAGPNGELTILGLDTHGRDLNTASTDPASAYSIGGLLPNTEFTLALWNANGDGTSSIGGTVTTNAAGVARFEVPLQAAFALTTLPVT